MGSTVFKTKKEAREFFDISLKKAVKQKIITKSQKAKMLANDMKRLKPIGKKSRDYKEGYRWRLP